MAPQMKMTAAIPSAAKIPDVADSQNAAITMIIATIHNTVLIKLASSFRFCYNHHLSSLRH